MSSEAEILEKITKEPVEIEITNYKTDKKLFLCRIGFFDAMVIDAIVSSIMDKITEAGIQDELQSRYVIGVVRMSAELCYAIKTPNAHTKEITERVFKDVETLRSKINTAETVRLHRIYRENYAFTEIEKKS